MKELILGLEGELKVVMLPLIMKPSPLKNPLSCQWKSVMSKKLCSFTGQKQRDKLASSSNQHPGIYTCY